MLLVCALLGAVAPTVLVERLVAELPTVAAFGCTPVLLFEAVAETPVVALAPTVPALAATPRVVDAAMGSALAATPVLAFTLLALGATVLAVVPTVLA
jgi:hypothetical protein